MNRYGVVFDLDDTLYLERDFVRSGFRCVAQKISGELALDLDQTYRLLWGAFQVGKPAFDGLLEKIPTVEEFFSISDLVNIYRFHKPEIQFLNGIPDLLAKIKKKNFLGIISDGWYQAQMNKKEALGLPRYFDEIILTDRWGRTFWKPASRAFEEMEKAGCGLQWIYIGDNPEKDFVQPNIRGWRSVRFYHPGQLHFDKKLRPQDEGLTIKASSTADLEEILKQWEVI